MAGKPEGGVSIFVIGLLGMLLCQVLGIIAWVQGNTYMQKCRNLGVEPEGIAVAGRILGMISSILFIIGLVGIFIALIIPAVGSQ
ncbi:MAG: hypothetical protein N2B57_02680 [Planctomycetales bacterium]